MQITLTADQEAQLSQIADDEGKATDEVANEVLNRGLKAEANFRTVVKIGQDAARTGDFVDQSALWAEIESVPKQ